MFEEMIVFVAEKIYGLALNYISPESLNAILDGFSTAATVAVSAASKFLSNF